jgi:hypothetical protein
MKVQLAISAECGELTCAPEPGIFCAWLGAAQFGTQPVCRLFPGDRVAHTVLDCIDGLTQRCDACKAAGRKDYGKDAR